MTQTPNPSELADFLNGTANEQASHRCEELLSSNDTSDDTVANLADTLGDDSLLTALRSKTEEQPNSTPDLDQLAEQIESLVPRHVITAEELSRLLDPPENVDTIGKIGRFEVVEFLASGGMGLVFHAIDPELNRDVCIKLLSPNHEFSPEAKSRFDRESREMAAMNCERIVTVLEVGRQNGLPYFVMPLLQGCSLRTLLNRSSEVSCEQSTKIVRQLAEGLDYAHTRGVLHRDIKPDNLWVLPSGDIKILDFGLAHIDGEASPITHSGTVIGTPSYMSPEQVNGKPLDARSDMFSVGVVLTEMLTGKSPFQKANLFSTLMSVASEKIDISELDPENKIDPSMRRVLEGLLQKDPVNRTESAAELLGQLDAIDSSQPMGEANSSTAEVSRGTFAGRVLGVAIGFAACFVAMMAWHLTDKGTLVVATDDPDVEVRIAGEKVTVVDPITERKFEIEIGETPLPSGVYQLEAFSSESGLAFSSQTIAIKRGKKSIVTVELLPIEDMTGDSAKTEIGANTRNPEANLKWADATYDSRAFTTEGQKEIAERLSQLKGLNLEELGLISGNRISEHATVTQPQPADGDPWSIESASLGRWEWRINADESMHAAIDGSWLHVRDPNLDHVIAMLPVPGISYKFQWDSTNPNLLAVSCWLGELSRHVILVWHVGKDEARLIRAVKAFKGTFALDRGYRVISFSKDYATSFNLVTEETWQIPDSSAENLLDDPVSPDGRYLMTYTVPDKRTQYSIFDLKEGRLVRAIHGPERIQWSDESSKVAAWFKNDFRSSPQHPLGNIRIIDLSTGDSELEFTPEKYGVSKSKGSLSPDFEVFASASSDGNVVLTDIKTGRKSKLQVNGSSGRNGSANIWWDSNRILRIHHSTHPREGTESKITLFEFRRETGIGGELKKLDPESGTALKANTAKKRIKIRAARFYDNGSLGVVANVIPSDQEKANVFYAVSADDKESTPSQRYACSVGNERLIEDLSSGKCLSPKGHFAFTLKNALSSRVGNGTGEVLCFRISDPEQAVNVGRFEWIRSIGWSEDEKYALLAGREHSGKGTGDRGKIIDLVNMTIVEVAGVSDWRDSVYDFVPLPSGFLICVSHSPKYQRGRNSSRMGRTGYLHRLVLFDPESSQEPRQIELEEYFKKEISSVSIRKTVDGTAVLSVSEKVQSAAGTESKRSLYSIDEDFGLNEMPADSEIVCENGDRWDFDLGEFEQRIRNEIGSINFVFRHSYNSSQFCVHCEHGLMMFDPVNKSLGRVFYEFRSAVRSLAVKEGWMLFSDDAISVYDFSGKLLKRRFLYVDTEAEEPNITGWVYSNGDGAKELWEKQSRKMFPKVVFEDGKYQVK